MTVRANRPLPAAPLPIPQVPADAGVGRLLAERWRRFDPALAPEVAAAIQLLSAALLEGHVCLALAAWAGRTVNLPGPGGAALRLPAAEEWRQRLLKSPLVGLAGAYRPLILDAAGDDAWRLYFARYWFYESQLAAALRARWCDAPAVDAAALADWLERLFPGVPADDGQRSAVARAVATRVALISGGPGTGKTTTVVKLLAALQGLAVAAGHGPLTIRLAAPTGKAAARLAESIRGQKGGLGLPDVVRTAIPERAATLHRLLGAHPDRAEYRHNAANPLPADVVVVDEASMLDLALVAKLVAALPPSARLVLLGDKDQLAAVEAGAVFGELCAAGVAAPPASGLARAVALLARSYRFDAASGIGALATAVNRGDVAAAEALLAAPPADTQVIDRGDALPASFAELVRSGFAAYVEAVAEGDPAAVTAAFQQFRVLAAHREGPFGVAVLNRRIEQALGLPGSSRPGAWYAGRAVVVERNDYGVRLFNGDIGIALPDERGELMVWFPVDGGGFRAVAPGRLPPHGGAFALTVHKSQGSEFDHVALVAPDGDSPVFTRPLLYTAITRAKRALTLLGRRDAWRLACQRLPERASGLAARLQV